MYSGNIKRFLLSKQKNPNGDESLHLPLFPNGEWKLEPAVRIDLWSKVNSQTLLFPPFQYFDWHAIPVSAKPALFDVSVNVNVEKDNHITYNGKACNWKFAYRWRK